MRAKGEGTIYPYRGGFAAQISLGYAAGKRIRKTVYGDTQAEVRRELTRLRRDLDQGKAIVTDERMTLAEFLSRWIAAITPSVRPKTLRAYSDHVRLHIAPAIGSIRLTALRPDQVQIFLNAKLQQMSPRSVRHLRATLRAALNTAVEWEMVSRNVAALTKPPRTEPREVRVLTPEEARVLLSVSQSDRLYALWVTTLSLGLRQGEVLGLRWQAVDWTRGTLRVDHTLQRIDGRLQAVPSTKTDKSARTLLMPPLVQQALRAHRAAQEAEKGSRGYVDHRLIFATTIGTPIDPRNLIREWHALTRRAGLPRLRFHDLRHSAASLMLAKGVPQGMVAEILGHADTQMVSKTYGHVLPHLRDEAAQAMQEVLG